MIGNEQHVMYLGDLLPEVKERINDETFHKARKDTKEPVLRQKDGERRLAVENSQSEAGANSPGYNSVDDIFQDIGANGPFQWLLIPILLLINVPGVFSMWLTYFIATDVHWKCVANSPNSSNTTCAMNITLPATDKRICNLDHSKWVYTDAPKSSLKSFFHLHCGREWLEHLATSSLFVGLAISSLISGSLADKYGRKKLLFIPFTIFLLAGIISAFSSSVEMFALLRFIQGLAVPSALQILYMILGEFTTSRHRVMLTNILLIGQAASMVLFSVLAYFIRDWTILVLLTTAPFMIALFTFKFVPESMYWLTLTGQHRKLILVVKQICHWNKRRLPDERKLKNVINDDMKHKSRLADLFKSSKMKIQSGKVLIGWFVLGLLYFGLGMAADDLTGALYRDFIIMRCVEVPSNAIATYLGNRFGRRKTTSANMLLASLACIGIPLVPLTGSTKMFRLILGIAGTSFVMQAYGLHIVWTLELYGTDLRAKAMGLSNFTSRMGGAAAPWIVKGLKNFDLGAPFFLEGGLGILSAILMYSLPETRNTSMKSFTERSSSGSCRNEAFDNDSEVSRDVITESSGDFVAFQRRFSRFKFPEETESYRRCGKRNSIDIIKDIVISRRYSNLANHSNRGIQLHSRRFSC